MARQAKTRRTRQDETRQDDTDEKCDLLFLTLSLLNPRFYNPKDKPRRSERKIEKITRQDSHKTRTRHHRNRTQKREIF